MVHISLKEQLRKIASSKNVNSLEFKDGETIEDALRDAAETLKDFLYKEMAEVYRRKEGWYTRSFMFSKSLDETVTFDPKTHTVSINFNDNAWHDSWITKTYNPSYSKRAYVPMGIIEGYEVFNTGHFVEGVDFIQNAIDKFNQVKRKGISVSVEGMDSLSGNWWR